MDKLRKNACNVLRSSLKKITGVVSIFLWSILYTGCSGNDSSHGGDQTGEAPVHIVLFDGNTSKEDLNKLKRKFANEA